MSAHDGNLLILFITVLLVSFRIYYLVHKLWKLPLDHGPRFFLSAEVGEGFYEGPGAGWLKRYRAIILTEHLIEAAIVAAMLGSHRLDLIPMWAGGSAIVLVTMLNGLTIWTRRRLDTGASARSKVAVALESRRLGDYLSWRVETLAVAVMAVCWIALSTNGDARTRWQTPAELTYVVLTVAALKILVVRNRLPLPAERAEAHYQYSEAQRRYSLRVIEVARWFVLSILAGYAMQHSWEPARTIVWLRWLPVAVALAIWLIQVLVQSQGQDRLTSMGRNLRPMGSWSGPFQKTRLMGKGGLAWGVCFLSGLAIIHLLFKH
jgi:hypothetical protein